MKRIDVCKLCELGITTSPVNGTGDVHCDIMFVTDSPSYHDRKNGMMLSGVNGRIFDQLLTMMTLDRADVYTTSLVKCRPPSNRIKLKNIVACKPYLTDEINAIKPRIIVTLGANSYRTITKRKDKLTNVIGTAIMLENGMYVVPMYHLSYVLGDVRNHKLAVAAFINLYKLYRTKINPAIANRENELHDIVKKALKI